MNDRRLDVLRAIVSQYVHTREPVGSKAIAQSQDLGVSSATIRNDMAVLEEAGLIYQPHTSAGRVPTDKGYRVLVDQLATLKPMSTPERQAVEKFLARAEDLDDVVMATVRLLAQVTRQVALIEYPVNARSTLSRIEFVDLSDSRLLIVVITEQGKVFERLREMPQDLAQEDLLTLRSVLNAAYQGKDAGEVRAHYEAMAECLPPALSGCAGDISEIIASLLQGEPSARIAMAGMSNLARSGVDFHDIAPVLDALEEQVVLLRLFAEMDEGNGDVHVSIGSENGHDAFVETSLVSGTYASGGNSAHVGILGPTRMDYASTMSTVHAVASYLSKYLNSTH